MGRRSIFLIFLGQLGFRFRMILGSDQDPFFVAISGVKFSRETNPNNVPFKGIFDPSGCSVVHRENPDPDLKRFLKPDPDPTKLAVSDRTRIRETSLKPNQGPKKNDMDPQD